jgi:hypothetical protein
MGVTREPEIDYAKSTGAYPMDPEPANTYVDSPIDYSESTMAYPMADDPTDAEQRLAHIGAEPVVQFVTPGPQTFGDPDALARQSTGVKSVDGGRADTKVVNSPDSPKSAGRSTAETK